MLLIPGAGIRSKILGKKFDFLCRGLPSSLRGLGNQLIMAKILLVEDDEDNISLLSRLLKHHGHELSVATDGEEATLRAREEQPELILMDLELPPSPAASPDPNAGLEATRRIKADPATARIPVIALTAHTMAHHHERIMAAGCDDFQEKPIYPFDKLLEKIERFVPRNV